MKITEKKDLNLLLGVKIAVLKNSKRHSLQGTIDSSVLFGII
jgi:hypothetical protein